MIFIYQLLFPAVAAGILLKIAFSGRGRALREGASDLRERLGLCGAIPSSAGPVWIHAASVGEVRAAEPLIAQLAKSSPRPPILVTTSTVSGRERARGLSGVDSAALAPMDFYPAILAFLGRMRPRVLILVETELWPMTLRLALRRGVRVGIANGRITERAFSRYRLIRGMLAPLLASVEKAAVQTAEDARRFAALGVRPEAQAECGNMKFDQPLPSEGALQESRAWVSALGWRNGPVWIAGSTHPGEEEIILDAHARALKTLPGLRLILAPRHPERRKEVTELLLSRGLSTVHYSELAGRTLGAHAPRCLLVDQMGSLGTLYGAASAAFVGGSLVPVGGHDLLEPARLGVPVLFGPHTESTQETAAALIASGGGAGVADARQLADRLILWLGTPENGRQAGSAAKASASAFSGAVARTFSHLQPLLSP